MQSGEWLSGPRVTANRKCREANMERETASDNVANSIVAARRWPTLEQLLEDLPLKKSYIKY